MTEQQIHMAIVFIIYLFALVSANLYSGDWTGAARIRDQGNTGMCWAFATVSYVEAMYNSLTDNSMLLSAEQVADAVSGSCDIYGMPGGGFSQCGLNYVRDNGIMTEYNYPFTYEKNIYFRYNPLMVTSIGIENISYHWNIVPSYEIIRTTLLSHPILISINFKPTPDCDEENIVLVNETNHAVMIVDAYIDSYGDAWIVYQNSHGIDWCNDTDHAGYGHLRICVDGNCYNNRGVFNDWTYADVYDKASRVDTYTEISAIAAIVNNLSLVVLAVVATIALAIIAAVVLVISLIIHKRMTRSLVVPLQNYAELQSIVNR